MQSYTATDNESDQESVGEDCLEFQRTTEAKLHKNTSNSTNVFSHIGKKKY
jgi:hypothetical protein